MARKETLGTKEIQEPLRARRVVEVDQLPSQGSLDLCCPT